VETLYLLGAEDCIAGISGFTTRPARARREKPRVSGFSSAKIERILAVNPDLVLAYSDLQADMVGELVRAGVEVHVFNQHDLAGILSMIRTLGALVDRRDEAQALASGLEARIDVAHSRALAAASPRPRVYFEEWNDPLICGIRWVSELIEAAGGEDCFALESQQRLARGRIIADPAEVIRRAPDIIIGSWCGKKFRAQHAQERAGWDAVPAVRDGFLHEIKSADILSPGPCAITDGLAQMERIVAQWRAAQARA
jgi:iron complex transport system substrate-binding protein